MSAPNGQFPSIDELRRVFRVDEHSRLWRRFAGKGWTRVGKIYRGSDYAALSYKGQRLAVHRIIWALHHGRAPRGLIDHINGQPWDNRIENLREATYAQNRWNANDRRNNLTGFQNVKAIDGKFRAYITVNYHMHWSPPFDDAELAALAASEMARKYRGEYAYEQRAA